MVYNSSRLHLDPEFDHGCRLFPDNPSRLRPDPEFDHGRRLVDFSPVLRDRDSESKGERTIEPK